MYTLFPEFVQPVFPISFFDSFIYHDRYKHVPHYFFSLLDSKSQCVAYCRFYKEQDMLYLPHRAPFGGIDFDERVTDEVLVFFISEIEKNVREYEIKKIRIALPPLCYHENKISRLKNILLQLNYSITIIELNYHIPISSKKYIDIIHRDERRELRQCHSQHYTCSIENSASIEEAYELIVHNRTFRNIPLIVTREQFVECFEKFPEQYILFSVRDKGALIATSTLVKVNNHIAYNFLPAYREQYKQYSPGILAMEASYNFCQEHGFTIFDLGIATKDGVRNEGLISFKLKSGAIETPKYVLEKMI